MIKVSHVFPKQNDVVEQIEMLHGIVKDINTIEQIKDAMSIHDDLYMVHVNGQFIKDYNGKPIHTIKYYYEDIAVYYDVRNGKIKRDNSLGGEIFFDIEESE